MSSFTVEIVTNHESGNGEVEVTWEVPLYWTPPRPATYLDPPEGGIELDGEPHPIAVTYYPELGDDYTIEGIQEGSILDILLSGKYPPPDEDECYREGGEYLQGEEEAAQEAAAEARLARMRGW